MQWRHPPQRNVPAVSRLAIGYPHASPASPAMHLKAVLLSSFEGLGPVIGVIVVEVERFRVVFRGGRPRRAGQCAGAVYRVHRESAFVLLDPFLFLRRIGRVSRLGLRRAPVEGKDRT